MREREHKQGGGAEAEADYPLSREPNAGLDPRTLESHPEPKADPQPLICPGAPWLCLIHTTDGGTFSLIHKLTEHT